jgi:putative oxidoreductase
MTIACFKNCTSAFYAKLNHLQPLWLLFIRVWVAVIFFKSGLTKIDDFETTIMLFEHEYAVPFIPHVLAAYSATFFELCMPILLVFGAFTRLAALPLLAMTAVIQFTYMDHMQHYYWAIMLSALIIFGAGKLSLDHLAGRKQSS